MKIRLIVLFVYFSNYLTCFEGQESAASYLPFEENAINDHVIWESALDTWWWPWEDEKKLEPSREPPIDNPPKIIPPYSPTKLMGLESSLKSKIVGQDTAIEQTVAALENYAYGLSDPNAPIASFLYVGPTGVGKTQLAKELAKNLFGSENSLVILNMSDYQQKDSAADLLGAPLGYQDHYKGGVLTNALKKNPYAIVLLDEIEKANPSVFQVLLPLFDRGFIRDKQGNVIDCRNMVFIMTSNLEAQKILTLHDLGSTPDEIASAIRPSLMKKLTPEFYNRVQPVIFKGLKSDVRDRLAGVLLLQTAFEIEEKTGIAIRFKPNIVNFLNAKCTDYQLGARPLKQMIQKSILGGVIAAIKQGYLRRGERAEVDFIDQTFIVQKLGSSHSFNWSWIEEEGHLQPPFNFENLLELEERLNRKILGQPYAIHTTVASLMRYGAGFGNDQSPIGAFLYAGPTGVGKTQLAKELAFELMGSEERLIRLDMAEYSEKYSITRLIGAPPGYKDFEAGGQLTEALKKDPYAIVLLDEIEKAHPAILKTFLSIFDEGRITDASGDLIDCRNAVFIATTNLAATKILSLHREGSTVEEIISIIQPEIINAISPELYNRLEVAAFMGLTPELLDELIGHLLNEVKEELQEKKKICVRFDSSLIEFLKMKGCDLELGARPLKRLIYNQVMTKIAWQILAKNIQAGDEIFLFYNGSHVEIEKIG